MFLIFFCAVDPQILIEAGLLAGQWDNFFSRFPGYPAEGGMAGMGVMGGYPRHEQQQNHQGSPEQSYPPEGGQ